MLNITHSFPAVFFYKTKFRNASKIQCQSFTSKPSRTLREERFSKSDGEKKALVTSIFFFFYYLLFHSILSKILINESPYIVSDAKAFYHTWARSEIFLVNPFPHNDTF